ncbi:MAG: hypothetical protein AB1480_15125 [Nitrospirota bacterium]
MDIALIMIVTLVGKILILEHHTKVRHIVNVLFKTRGRSLNGRSLKRK